MKKLIPCLAIACLITYPANAVFANNNGNLLNSMPENCRQQVVYDSIDKADQMRRQYCLELQMEERMGNIWEAYETATLMAIGCRNNNLKNKVVHSLKSMIPYYDTLVTCKAACFAEIKASNKENCHGQILDDLITGAEKMRRQNYFDQEAEAAMVNICRAYKAATRIAIKCGSDELKGKVTQSLKSLVPYYDILASCQKDYLAELKLKTPAR